MDIKAMKQAGEKFEIITAEVPEIVEKVLEYLALQEGVTVSELIMLILCDYCDEIFADSYLSGN